MIEATKTIEKLTDFINNATEGSSIDLTDLIECVEALKAISEEKDIHRYEVVASGYVRELSYIHHEDKKNGLVKFLFEKMRRASNSNAIRGCIVCVISEEKLTEKIMNGDRVKIWADFSPYETHREDGMTFHKLKLWVDKLERVDRGISDWVPRKERVAG